ncbi:hypothetical protein COT65_01290 [Candidatus Shapirobacteria bacterium CG09_land_8_20_14_0_10_47_13]|uniref:Metallo-beta-lactamase domain-containing protein n=1 Tax=Candidatus Shapirobacteria bacterium CG09_land_8_20_14_0_10_47_13 TaxID=1974481 RepID=A0A2H0WMW0_9BACT|nr:MAG: hypothetical protein COT65_01290 [Candidatus Shapirobacteria bacterium CG09_land_8_20_14_0_10_47_13]
MLLALSAWGAVGQLPDTKLHLVFCDVGQGDAILASLGSTQMLIDGGPNDRVLECLAKHMPFWDKTIELVVVTHPEADHLTGIVSVIERYNVVQIISNSLVADSGVFGKFREEVIAKKIPVFSPKYGDKIEIAKLELKILSPAEKLGNELVWVRPESPQVLGLTAFAGKFNETAIVGQLSFGNFDALLTGDIGFDTEEKLVLTPIEVLKIAHHGSKYSSGEDFLAKLKPALAVISVGKNSYGHPTAEVLGRLRDLGIKILRTDEAGDIEIISDGQNWQVR